MWLPVIFHGAAFTDALWIHNLSSYISGLWFLLLFAGIAVLVKDGYTKQKGLWYACLVWLCAIMASCFVLSPIPGSSAQMWAMAAMPMMALCIKKDHLNAYLAVFGGVTFLYAIGIIYQFVLNIHQPAPYNYNWFDKVHPAPAWPTINPNNAAVIINCALLPCLWLSLHKVKWLKLVTTIFAISLLCTASKAGILAAIIGCSVMFISQRGIKWWYGLVVAGITLAVMSPFGAREIKSTWGIRTMIWDISVPMLNIKPLTGLGLGAFPYYYAQLRIEHFTAGYWAHNDLLQIAIEMGIPAAIVFCWLWVEVFRVASLRTLPALCVIGAVLFQSMLEFQIYVPSISMLLGLAVAWYYHNTEYEIW